RPYRSVGQLFRHGRQPRTLTRQPLLGIRSPPEYYRTSRAGALVHRYAGGQRSPPAGSSKRSFGSVEPHPLLRQNPLVADSAPHPVARQPPAISHTASTPLRNSASGVSRLTTSHPSPLNPKKYPGCTLTPRSSTSRTARSSSRPSAGTRTTA